MTWRIEYTESARRDLRALDHAVAQQVLRKLDAIKENPLRAMKRLRGSRDWRLRVGDWRVVAQVDASDQTLSIKRIQHRRVVYDSTPRGSVGTGHKRGSRPEKRKGYEP